MGRLLPVVTMVCFGLASLSSAPGADVYTDRGLVRAICIVHDRTSEISSAARKILEANVIAVYNVLGLEAFTWNGQAADGNRIPSGVYFIRINTGD